MKTRALLLALAMALLFAAPAAGQTQTVCGIKYPVNTAPLVDTLGKRTVTDSIACLRTSGGSAMTQLRNRLFLRDDSLRRRPREVDSVPLFVPVPGPPLDTLFCSMDGCTWDPPAEPQDTLGVPIPPDPPPAGEKFDRVIADTIIACPQIVLACDLVVPDSQVWLLGRNVEVRRGSVRTTNGTVAIRDGSSVHLTGGDPDDYVGGGNYWSTDVQRDYGIWIGGPSASGKLDIACSAVTAWNHEGTASDWKATDELWVTPVAVGDFLPHRFTLGAPVPRADPLVPPAEVINVSRSCRIYGTGHIHIHSNAKQRIQNVLLDSLGVSNFASKGPVTGRYVLHEHLSGDGSRGTIISGVAATNSRGRVFVPHGSHGITMLDNVSVNSYGECFWWDFGEGAHLTRAILVERLACSGVYMPDEIGGTQSNIPGISLAAGDSMEMRNSVVSGVRGGSLATGFDWPEPTAVFGSNPKLVWRFDKGNVAHNNVNGLRFWTNLGDFHVVQDFTSYRNLRVGMENGAYITGTEYHDVRAIEDGYTAGGGEHEMAGFLQNGNNSLNTAGRPGQITDCLLKQREGPAYRVGHRQRPAEEPQLIARCTFIPGPGSSKIEVWTPDDNPWLADIVSSDVRSADIVFKAPIRNGSLARIDNDGDGVFECRVWTENGQKKASGC